MKLVRFISLFFILVPLFLPAANVTITATPYTSDVQTFMLSDFNFTGRGTSAAELFILTITNHTVEPQQCELVAEIFSENQGPLASGHTKPFTLEGNEHLAITNRNLFTTAHEFALQDYNIKDVGDELTATLLATGRLPADTYIFRFQLLQAGGGLLGDAEIRFVLTNPSTLDLISPGVSAGSAEEGFVYTAFPLFRWESDITTFKLTIAEQLPDAKDDLSPEEIMQQRIVFERTLTVDKNMSSISSLDGEVIPSTIFQYPVAGARSLEDGKTYYWQLIGLVKSSGAPIEFPSEIWKFQLVGTGASHMLTPLQQQILALVRELDDSVLKPGGALYGFIPNETVSKNGVVLEEDAILNTLAKMVNGDIDVLEISVE